ncbi:MAG: hypothetical protein RM049_22625 [Nostoc sp. DedQUE04]|uniref:hypothetical protein n=1 Tax=Nostoc sp. DedQUE04 TaxID=3075390 RepID=UPI002AD4168D|nr:hypothetical protein [Nostoc sp. DedQUE04]MDZ8138065.1 hypothetical protein [Nostoc sp. DedQUE04]
MATISSENQHLTEWQGSGVDEEIFHLNVRSPLLFSILCDRVIAIAAPASDSTA